MFKRVNSPEPPGALSEPWILPDKNLNNGAAASPSSLEKHLNAQRLLVCGSGDLSNHLNGQSCLSFF